MDPNSAVPQDCLQKAMADGVIAGLKASVVSGGLYLLAWRNSPFFRHTFSASSRTALTVMPIFYTGYLNTEFTMHKCMEANKPQYVAVAED